jgi:hypothetical protein
MHVLFNDHEAARIIPPRLSVVVKSRLRSLTVGEGQFSVSVIWLRQIDVARQKCVGFVVVSYEELRVRRDRRDCNCAVRL